MTVYDLVTDDGQRILYNVSLETLKLYFALGYAILKKPIMDTPESVDTFKWREFKRDILPHLIVEAHFENGNCQDFKQTDILRLLFSTGVKT